MEDSKPVQSIRMVFLDLDGTLLSSTHQILESSEQAIQQLIAQQISVIITTGRSFSGMQEAVKDLPFTLSTPVSVHNGALILDRDQVARRVLLHKDAIVGLVNKARSLNIHIGFQTDFKTYLEEDMGEYEWVYKLHGIVPIMVEDLLDIEIDLVKVSFYGDKNDISELLAYFNENGDVEQVSFFRSGLFYADATAKQATKLSSAQWICDKFGIAAEQTLAIGDHYNDVAMLEWAGVGVAMGNAKDDVKEIANFVTKSNDQHGVFYALKSFGLLV